MLNATVKREKFGIGSFILLFVAGIVFAGAGLFAVKDTKVDPDWTKISAEVVEVVSGKSSKGAVVYRPVLQYAVNGNNYKITSPIGSSFQPTVGEKGEVAYNPHQPDQAQVVEGVGNWLFILLFPIVGIGLLIMAPILFIRSLKRNRIITNLLQVGQKLDGILVDIQSVSGSSKKGSYKIVVSATNLAGTVQNYVSDTINNIGGLTMADFRNNPIAVAVYVDLKHPELYYVDVSNLPNITSQEIANLLNQKSLK